MTRYVPRRTKPRAEDDDYIPDAWSPESMTVHETEQEPEPTGILDQSGNEYFRHPDKRSIGFTAKWK